jgi:hypothetical protein
MDSRSALKEQFHAGLAMLADSVGKCPDDLWSAPTPPIQDEERVIYRSYWRIAFHTAYFTHLYLGQNEDTFQPWPERRKHQHEGMWQKPWDLEPYEMAGDTEPYTKKEILEYITYVDGLIDPTIDTLDLDSEASGFSWYPKVSKLSHELMNLRHLQGHIGQLSELLMMRGIDTEWVSRGK